MLAELPQLLLQRAGLGQFAGLTEKAIVVVQSGKARQLIGRGTVDTCSGGLLLQRIEGGGGGVCMRSVEQEFSTYQWLGKGTHYSKEQAIEPIVTRQLRGDHVARMQRADRYATMFPALENGECTECSKKRGREISPRSGSWLTCASSWAKSTLQSLTLL